MNAIESDERKPKRQHCSITKSIVITLIKLENDAVFALTVSLLVKLRAIRIVQQAQNSLGGYLSVT